MKLKYLLPALLLITLQLNATQSYKLCEAIQKNLVSVKVNGAKPDTSGLFVSSHVGPCMAMEVANSTTESLLLSLEYGYKLVPEDTGIQTMIVTQTMMVSLAPKQKKNYRIYAMCTEAHDGGPSPEQGFRLGKRFGGNVLGLAEVINRKRYQTDAAQNAVWCLTNNYDLSRIHSDDTTQMYDLRRFVAKAKGLPLASIYEPDAERSYTEPPQPAMHIRTVYSGSLRYSVSRTSKVMIALFDENNHMKKVYVNNETQREGQYTYNYELSSDEMENKKHYLRLFRDGRLEEEMVLLPQE